MRKIETEFHRPKHGFSNKVYNSEKFSIFELGPIASPGGVIVKDCIFNNCEVYPGTFTVNHGVELNNVLFNETDLKGGKMCFCADACVCDQVKIISKAKHSKWLTVRRDLVLPKEQLAKYNAWVNRRMEDIEWCLDISEYHGSEVEIIGIPAEKIKINPAKHIIVSSYWKDNEKWLAGIDKVQFWKIALRKVVKSDFNNGIFSIPSKKSKLYKETVNELNYLESVGLIGSEWRL